MRKQGCLHVLAALLLPYRSVFGSGGIMDDERLLAVKSGDPDLQTGAWHRGQRKRVPFEASCFYTHEPELKYGCQYEMKNTPQWAQDPQRREEKLVLVDLFALTTGEDWRVNDNWLELGDPCWDFWYGITCNEHGYVTEINLADNHLVGYLPATLGKLTSLLKIDVSTTANDFHAHPNTNANDIRGPLPSLTGARRIEEIEISGNSFESLPADLWMSGNTLRVLSASRNFIRQLPAGLRRFTALHTLELGSNQIADTFPEDVGSLSNARFVQLEYNQLTGTIPAEIVGMSRIRVLDLSHNTGLTGEIPKDILTLWREIDYLSILNTTIGGYVGALCIDVPFCWSFMYDTHGDVTWATSADVPDIVTDTVNLALGGSTSR